ncbi:hypothetical protein [Flavobacterium sp. WV_118_3]|uniref:bZIP transcription factor n=1 Tax=Flavobacterium sp. WV_118_3 TaxID=3151764 RepID=UPI00321C33D9
MRQQKEQQMLDIIHKLETDQYYAVKVVDTNTNEELGNNLTGQKMISDFGSVESFFKYLISKGINRITVYPKRKNGSTFVFKEHPIIFKISDSNDYQRELQPAAKPLQQTPEPLQQNVIQMPMPAVQPALNGPFGLGFPEYVGLHVAANDKTRLETENEFLKKENERLKNENQELKEERLKKEYDTAKATGNKELLMGLGEILGPIVGKFIGGGAAAPSGLNAPEYNPQQAVLNESPQLAYLAKQSPDFLQYITGICHAINTLPGFYDELNQLIEKYQTNDSNDTNTGN